MVFLLECFCLIGIGAGGFILIEVLSERHLRKEQGKRPPFHKSKTLTAVGFITIPFIILVGLLHLG